MTENEHPKPDKRANVSATELIQERRQRGARRSGRCSPACTTELRGRKQLQGQKGRTRTTV